uniref:conjugal transfer protein n=1 Tax=Tetragenococcus halophilus TaxID=51669 RepID=UPI0024E15617|nr:conjugal transfer protein [Tetragenococcus halophilus]
MKFKRQSKPKKQKIPKQKKAVNSKLIARLLWGGIIFWILLTVFSFIRMNAISTSNREMKSQVETLQKKTESVNLLNQDSSLDTFLKRYATNYLSLSDDDDQMENRLNVLESMSASDLEIEDKKLQEGSQSLTSILPFNYRSYDEFDVATYNVVYELKTKEKEEEYSVGFNIPVQRLGNDEFVVVAEPFITDFNVNDLNGSGNRLTSSITQEKNDSKTTEKRVNDFLEQFLTTYQEGDVKQLGYLMNNPEGLNGQYQLSVDSFEVYGSNEKPIVEVQLIVRQKDTDVSYPQQMQLSLVTKDEKYFVDKMEQVIH